MAGEVGAVLEAEALAVGAHPRLGVERKGVGCDRGIRFAGAETANARLKKRSLSSQCDDEGPAGKGCGLVDRIEESAFYSQERPSIGR